MLLDRCSQPRVVFSLGWALAWICSEGQTEWNYPSSNGHVWMKTNKGSYPWDGRKLKHILFVSSANRTGILIPLHLSWFFMFLMFHVAIWLICYGFIVAFHRFCIFTFALFVSSSEVSQLEQSLQKGELTLAELWYRSQPSMDTFALLQHGSVSSASLCLKTRPKPGQACTSCTSCTCGIPNLQGFARKTRNQTKWELRL